MANQYGPRIVTDGLVLCLDAGNRKSYPGTGTTWADLSGNGYVATFINGVGFTNLNNGSFIFDGTNDYMTLTNDSTIANVSGLTDFTVEGIVKWNIVPTAGNGQWIMGNVNPTGGLDQLTGGLQIGYVPSVGFTFSTYKTGGAEGVSYSIIPITNVWYHVLGLKLSTGYYLYINGSLVNQFLTSNNGGVAPTSLSIGIRQRDLIYPSTTMYLNGNIASVRIYSKALSSSEIRQNFEATKGRYGL